jgi:hypothetical protein
MQIYISAFSELLKIVLLTLQVSACITASNPPSGASRFPEISASSTFFYKQIVTGKIE